MGFSANSFALLLAGGALLSLGSVLRRRVPDAAWFALVPGYGLIALLAFAHLTGRFGADELWFRAPVFWLAAAILLGGLGWWVTRPATRFVRFGMPALAAVVATAALIGLRLQGSSAPLTMLMPTMGKPAPDLTFYDESGSQRRLSELRGKVVLINFWATWCAPCRKEMPLLSRMQREHEGAGLVVLYLSLEEPAVLEAFLAKNDFDGVRGRLGEAPPFYGAGKFYPLSYLVSRDGRIENRWSGRPDERWLDDVIRREL